MKMLATLCFLFAFAFIPQLLIAQEDSSSLQQLSSLPAKYYDKLSQKLNGFEQELDKQTDKYLNKLERQEARLYKKLWKKDSSATKQILGNTKERYSELRSKATEQANQLSRFSKVYSSKLDSLGTAFSFLENNKLVSHELTGKITNGVNAINGLKDKLNQADQIKKYIKERRQLLTSQLEKFGLVKELKQFNRQFYYYQQQIREYKETLENPEKLEKKLLSLVTQVPAFKEFFANHSELGALFNLPGSMNNSPAALAGLQTRASVIQDLQGRFGTGQAVQQMLQQNIQSAQGQLNELKNKVNQYWPQGGGSSDEEMPDFKPNQQKTKSFWQRLEYGTKRK